MGIGLFQASVTKMDKGLSKKSRPFGHVTEFFRPVSFRGVGTLADPMVKKFFRNSKISPSDFSIEILGSDPKWPSKPTKYNYM